MTISAKMIADSISPAGKRISTLELRYPRFIHPEELTHRLLSSMNGDTIEIIEKISDGLMYDKNLSRNASSSRAIPVERMIQNVLDDPAIPVHWGKNQPGMQAREEHDEVIKFHYNDGSGVYDTRSREEAWLYGRDQMIKLARAYAEAGYHKQIVNRLLEPWLHINVVVTATEWDNFFTLRDHPDAQPEIRELARQMRVEMDRSEPVFRGFGDWHLPYVDQDPGADSNMVWDYAREHDLDLMYAAKMLSVARCASVSYKTVDGKPMTMERAAAIYDKLVKADVFHASPFEHQAKPDQKCVNADVWVAPGLHGNFTGWIQNRKLMEADIG